MMAARQLEQFAEVGASACLGGAVAFAIFAGMTPVVAQPLSAVPAGAAAILAFWLSRRVLTALAPPVARVAVAAPVAELLLETVVASGSDARPDAQVVRLFDPAAMSTSRQAIAPSGPMADDRSSAAPPDASQDLRDALNQLRRSLHQS